jgi:hypothetical protein
MQSLSTRRLLGALLGVAAILVVAANPTYAADERPGVADAVAAAPACVLGADAPSGGGSSTTPIRATGRILCSSTVFENGAVLNVYLKRDNVTVASAPKSVTGRSAVMLAVTTSCSTGNFSTLVTATVPGANLSQPVISSAIVPISCGTVPPPSSLTIGTVSCQSGNSQFICDVSGVSGGTPPYRYSWVSMSNAAITWGQGTPNISGRCTPNQSSSVRLTVTDNMGSSVSGLRSFRCSSGPILW